MGCLGSVCGVSGQRPRRAPPARVPAEKAAAPAGRLLVPGVVVV
jgi:hypothetical protein